MWFFHRFAFTLISCCALMGSFNSAAFAGTIIKLSLGSVSPDIEYDGSSLRTVDDLNASTDGDQDTAIDFTGFLDPIKTDVPTAVASFTMSGLVPSGSAFVFLGQSIVQNFTGGTFTLYAPDNSKLLTGSLANSALTGPVGFSSGGLFTTSFGTVTGGSLQSLIAADSLVVSMNFTDVKTTGGPVGFSVSPPPASPPPDVAMGTLLAFTADSPISIAGEAPEPGTLVLLLVGALAVQSVRRRR
jgi:PEP-CTERM motif